jgi:hypothetical protein
MAGGFHTGQAGRRTARGIAKRYAALRELRRLRNRRTTKNKVA